VTFTVEKYIVRHRRHAHESEHSRDSSNGRWIAPFDLWTERCSVLPEFD
jgi:hypothetical protein